MLFLIRNTVSLGSTHIFTLIFHFPNPFQTPTQLCHRIEEVFTITTVLHSTLYLFWKLRYRSCQFFVYEFLLSNRFESGHVLWVVRKVLSRRSRRSLDRGNWFRGSGDI